MSALEVFNNNTVSVSGVSFREEEGRLIHMAVVCVRVGDEGPKATMVWSVDTVTGESIRRVTMDDTDTSDHRFTRWLVELSISGRASRSCSRRLSSCERLPHSIR